MATPCPGDTLRQRSEQADARTSGTGLPAAPRVPGMVLSLPSQCAQHGFSDVRHPCPPPPAFPACPSDPSFHPRLLHNECRPQPHCTGQGSVPGHTAGTGGAGIQLGPRKVLSPGDLLPPRRRVPGPDACRVLAQGEGPCLCLGHGRRTRPLCLPHPIGPLSGPRAMSLQFL